MPSPIKDDLYAIVGKINLFLSDAKVYLFGSFAAGTQREAGGIELCAVGHDTKMRSIDIERSTPKFLKNWETQLFQKLAGVASRRLIPSCNLLIATWYEFQVRQMETIKARITFCNTSSHYGD